MKNIYIAGVITGDPDYKAKFNFAEATLKAAGFNVLNPAILPDGFSYGAYIRISTAMLNECEGVCFLKGWLQSPGANHEKRLAEHYGLKIFYFEEWLRDTVVGRWLLKNEIVSETDTMRELTENKKGAQNNDIWRKGKKVKNGGGFKSNRACRQNRGRNKQERKPLGK